MSFALTLLFALPKRPALALPMSVFCEFKAPDCDCLWPSTLRLVSPAASTAADDRLHKTMTVPVKNFMVISFVGVELLSLTTTSSAVPGTVLHPLPGENCCACVDDRSTARNCTRRFSAAYGFCGIKGCVLLLPSSSLVCVGLLCLVSLYCFTAAARRCERRRLYS